MFEQKDLGSACGTYLGFLALLPFTLTLMAVWTLMPQQENIYRRKQEAKKARLRS